MATFQPSVEKNNEKYQYNSMGTHHSEDPEATRGNNQDIYRNLDIFDDNKIINEHALLLPDGGNIESDNEDQYLQEEDAKRLLEYRHQNRFIILFLVALTPAGVKFFKAAQSSFQEYLMNDPRLYMSATTYSLSLSLMSLPIATLIGGLMLDYKAKKGGEQSREKSNKRRRTRNCLLDPSQQSCLGTARSPSNSAILFLGISLVGILIYGYGLEMMHSVPMGLVGSTIFGLGEGCVVVASRTFVAHAFYGSDGAFAQGVLVAMNNVAMMASKITLPWLIENEKKVRSITSHCLHNMSFDCLDDDSFAFDHDDNFAFDHNTTIENYDYSRFETEDNDNNIWVGVMACCMVQLMSLSAGIIYAWWFGCVPPPQSLQLESSQESRNPSHIKPSKKKKMAFLSSDSSVRSRVITCFEKLPTTFWIVAIGRAIFIVVFKVFTRNSNSFLMVSKLVQVQNLTIQTKLITAGHISHYHHLLCYRRNLGSALLLPAENPAFMSFLL